MDDQDLLAVRGLAELAHRALIRRRGDADDVPGPVRRFHGLGGLARVLCRGRSGQRQRGEREGGHGLLEEAGQLINPILRCLILYCPTEYCSAYCSARDSCRAVLPSEQGEIKGRSGAARFRPITIRYRSIGPVNWTSQLERGADGRPSEVRSLPNFLLS